MKMNINNRNVNFLLFANLLVFFISCEKPTEDYRDKWIGTYDCEKKYSSTWSSLDSLGNWTDNSYDFQDKVTINVTKKENTIINITEIGLEEYAPGVKHDVTVNDDGSFEKKDIKPIISGNFSEDCLYVEYFDFSPNISIRIIYKCKKRK